MIQNGLVSVIVPVYNVEPYLAECICSIQKQTYRKLEIILIDDGSTDCSGKICDEYAKSDIRIKVFHQKNRGVSVTRNVGLKNMTGEFLLFVDADDQITDNCVETLLNRIDEDGTDVVVQLREDDPPYSDKFIVIDDNFTYDRWRFCLWVTGHLYRSSIIKNIYFDEELLCGEDTLFVAQVIMRVDKLSCVSERLYIYRIRLGSLMHSGCTPERLTGIESRRKMAALYFDKKKIYYSCLADYGAVCKNYYYLLSHDKDQKEQKKYLLQEVRSKIWIILKSKRNIKDKRNYLVFCIAPHFYCTLSHLKAKICNKEDNFRT